MGKWPTEDVLYFVYSGLRVEGLLFRSTERKLAEEVLNGLKSKAGRRPPSASTVCLNQIRQCSSSTDFSADSGLRVFFSEVKHEFVRPFALADSSDASFWKIDCISLSFHLALPRLDFSVLSSP